MRDVGPFRNGDGRPLQPLVRPDKEVLNMLRTQNVDVVKMISVDLVIILVSN